MNNDPSLVTVEQLAIERREMNDERPLATDPELLKKLSECKTIWQRMTSEERAETLRLQAESWSRQDMD
jgi:hypothetical protein